MKIAFNPSTVAALTTPPNNKDITFDLRGRNIFARGVKFYGTDTNTWRDIKINNVSIGSNILDLRNGSNTTLTNTNGVVTINSTWRPVVDNLTSDSTTSSLSAKQGKVLKALIDGKSNSDHNHDGRYLKLTGGTMASNAMITFADSGSWNTDKGPQGARGGLYWTGQSDYAKLYAEETVGDNLDLVIQFGDDNSNGLSIRNKANTQTSYISSSGVITTGTFKGNLDWSYITNKPSSYTPSAHTHTVFKNNLMIKGTNGISDSASIHLGIGDSDTGFKWISDGVCQIYANNAVVGQWTSGGMNWFKNPTVNGNKVWNAGNDGSGSGLDADTLDGYHAASFVKMKQFRFNQYKEGFWTKILTITINSTSDLQPVIAFNWIPSECAREVWAEFTINWRSNSPIFYAIWKGTAVRTLTCVNSSGNIWNVWVQGDKNNYDPFGEVQVTYAHNISSYNGGSLGYSDSDPGGTRCTLGGYVNYARSTGNADTVDGQHASAFSYKSWWHWYGKDGQPNWLWGGNNENDYYVYNPSNFRVAYAASAGNADTLDGYPANGSNDRPYGHIPTIESDGVMEVGRYIDFHNDNNGKHDFSTRLQSTGNYGNEVNLPSASGTLALINDVNNYYWANVKISASSSTTTSPTVHTLIATRVCVGHNPGIDNSISCSNWFRSSGNTGWYNTTYQGGWYMSDTSWIRAHNGVGIYTSGQIYSSSSIRMSNILLEHTDEINNSANGGIHLNYRNSGNVSLCCGGGNVGIGTTTPSYKLDVNGQMRASGFHHASVNSDNYMLLAGGGYKSFGGDDSTPIFLGCLDLYRGDDGTISSSFYCLGYSVPFTYTRGGNYCKIVIPDTTRLSFYIIAATASVNYSGGGMDTWTGYHRGSGAWWLHCYAFGWNEVRVKGFCQADKNNDSWWGGNPLWNNEYGANRITVCIFGHVKYK